jgi:hypothetical protein
MAQSYVKVAKNRRYFVDANDNPLFWMGDTQWNLFRCHTLEEADVILKNRSEKGFSFIQAFLLGVSNEFFGANVVAGSPVYGEAFPNNDPSSPNEAYFKHVDSIIKLAWKYGICLVISLDHPRIKLVDMDTAQAYGQWIGERYKNYPNIIWVPTNAVPQGKNLEIMRRIVSGLEKAGVPHLITSHPDPVNPIATSGIAHDEQWLDFNCIQVFKDIDLIPASVAIEYCRIPAKPAVMAEGAYENGPEYGFEITPYLIRKQAYLTYFMGGHYSYGHNDNWRVNPTWKSSLDSPGAKQLKILRDIFTSRKWWQLEPDQSIFHNDKYSDTIPGIAYGLKSTSDDLIMVYARRPATFPVNMEKMHTKHQVAATWVNPADGSTIMLGKFKPEGMQMFSTPPGFEDSLLILECI